MRKERISEDIYAFFSDEYAEVTAALILAGSQVVLVDTLPFPRETRVIRELLRELGRERVDYVINTHHHSDHTYGNYLFPEAVVIAHRDCRLALAQHGEKALAEAKESTPALAGVVLRLPDITFAGEMALHLDKITIELMHLPGHAPDSCGVYVKEERVLLAGDVVMPIPTFARGDIEELISSLNYLKGLALEVILPGHGEVILRGEIRSKLEANLRYLRDIQRVVRKKLASSTPGEALDEMDLGRYVEEPKIVLQGLGYELHRANLRQLYRSLRVESPRV